MSASELVDFLNKQAGEHLRGVLQYEEGATNLLYVREDVGEQRIQSQYDRIVERVRPESTTAEERAFPFGDLHVTVRRFDEAILLHFPIGQDRGVIIALEPEASRDLNTFTTECLKRIPK